MSEKAKDISKTVTAILIFSSVIVLMIVGCISNIGIRKKAAHSEGYDAGYEAGTTAGYPAGYDAGYNEAYKSAYDDGYNAGLNERANDLNALKLEHSVLSREYEAILPEYNFFHNGAVIVTATAGEKYHHYDCGHISGRDIYIYNIELAKAKGYTPCADCWHDLPSLSLPPLQ